MSACIPWWIFRFKLLELLFFLLPWLHQGLRSAQPDDASAILPLKIVMSIERNL